MARRKAKLGIVPRLLKNAVTVGVIPACATSAALGLGCTSRQPPPVVAAMGWEYGDSRMPPVVAAYVQPDPEPADAGVEALDAGDAGDAGLDAGVAPVPTSTFQPPVVAAYPRGNGVPRK